MSQRMIKMANCHSVTGERQEAAVFLHKFQVGRAQGLLGGGGCYPWALGGRWQLDPKRGCEV